MLKLCDTGASAEAPRRRWSLRRTPVMVCLVFAAFGAGASGAALAQSVGRSPVGGLSLDAALRAAESRSGALVAQDAAVDSARQMALQAARLPDPVLRLSIDNLPVDGPQRWSLAGDFMTMRSIGLAQTLTREGKRQARASRYEREADEALAVRTARLLDLRRHTARAWFDLHYQQQLLDLLSQQKDELALQVEAASAAYRAGRGGLSDVFMARMESARVEDRIQEARAQEANAALGLARWTGAPHSGRLGPVPAISRTRALEQGLEQHMAGHPDVALMDSKEAVAWADVEVAVQDKQADWSVSAMYSRRGSAFSDMVSLAVSVPLTWDQKNRQDRNVSAQLARAAQARAEREETLRERLTETKRWFHTWRSHLARLSDYDANLIPLAASRTEAELLAYRNGKAGLSSVLESRRLEIGMRIERLRIEMATAALWVELEYLGLDAHGSEPPARPQGTASLLESKP